MASPALMASLSLIVPFLAGKFRAWRSGVEEMSIIGTSSLSLSLSSCSIDNVKVKVLKSEDKFEVVKIMYISRIIITLNTVNDA